MEWDLAVAVNNLVLIHFSDLKLICLCSVEMVNSVKFWLDLKCSVS